MPPETPNADQTRYWNEEAGPRWVDASELLDAQLAPLGRATLDRLAPGAGTRVLDVGCGCGHSTLDIAARVGPAGHAVGIDVSAPMLARARERSADVPNASFLEADAQTHRFDEPFDAVFSRFGVMFFADPVAAFANLARALVPGGRLAFVCWQELPKNAWILRPLQAIAPHVKLPAPPEPGAPGPFSFADPERVRGILEDAGLADVALTPLEDELALAGRGSLDETVDFLAHVGPTSAALREADAVTRAKALSAVREALAPFVGEGGVRMPFAAWIATARRA